MTDEELMVSYRQGSYDAFSLLYKRHQGRVMGYLVTKVNNLDEAEDIFQEVFSKLHKSRNKYCDDFPFLPWFFTLIKHVLIDYMRKDKRKNSQTILSQETVDRAMDERTGEWDVFEAVSEIHSLSEAQQQIIAMRFDEGLTFTEIADSLGISQVNARKIISRAMAKLRKLIQQRDY